MHFLRIIWDQEDDPDGNIQHVAEHGLSVEEVEEVLENPTSEGTSDLLWKMSTSSSFTTGWTRIQFV
jgi:hypothetical protein